MHTINKLEQDYLQHILQYNSLTGIFVWNWRNDVANNINGKYAGAQAGGIIHCNGKLYWAIRIQVKCFLAHRLAWAYMYNEWPVSIDHINGNGLDNSIDNLRPATQSQNNANSYSIKKGVEKHGKGYRATIFCQNKRYRSRQYETIEEAQLAYNKLAGELYGEFARCNRV